MTIFITYLVGVLLTSVIFGLAGKIKQNELLICSVQILLWPFLLLLAYSVLFGLIIQELKKK
jgi:hypothetical protein